MLVNFILPKNVKAVLDTLWQNGFEAYIVGGPVRDILMGINPNDYDICTNALPNMVKDCFSAFKTIDTGIKHGTVTLIYENEAYEITTFRSEKDYLDHRHPQIVNFENDLKQDLSRRDFTINAMAYSEKTGLIDIFNGQNDIKNKIIRTVLNPEKRFEEDCLRLLRAVRFSATLGFDIEERTKNAIKSFSKTIFYSSKERQYNELKKLILGDFASEAIISNKELIFELIPEINNINFEKNVMLIKSCEKDFSIRMAILLSDTTNVNLENLKFSKKEISTISTLISCKSKSIPQSKEKVLKTFFEFGTDLSFDLIEVLSVLNGQNACTNINFAKQFTNCCHKISMLNITGNDLKNLGFNGKQIGENLNRLLLLVIEDKICNTREILLENAKI